jgi:signal transduction histidine kinase
MVEFVFPAAAVVFLLLTIPVSRFLKRVDDRWRKHSPTTITDVSHYRRVLESKTDMPHGRGSSGDDTHYTILRPDVSRVALVNLNSIVASAIRNVTAGDDKAADLSLYRFEVTLGPTRPAVVDRSTVNTAIRNILQYTCDTMPSGGVVRIKTGMEGPLVFVSVSDRRSGVPDDARKTHFEPYSTARLGSSTQDLELSIAAGIVRSHGGEMKFDTQPGEGSTFTILLPTGSGGSSQK